MCLRTKVKFKRIEAEISTTVDGTDMNNTRRHCASSVFKVGNKRISANRVVAVPGKLTLLPCVNGGVGNVQQVEVANGKENAEQRANKCSKDYQRNKKGTLHVLFCLFLNLALIFLKRETPAK